MLHCARQRNLILLRRYSFSLLPCNDSESITFRNITTINICTHYARYTLLIEDSDKLIDSKAQAHSLELFFMRVNPIIGYSLVTVWRMRVCAPVLGLNCVSRVKCRIKQKACFFNKHAF